MQEVKVIGQMDNTVDRTFESANRVYDTGGISPTVNTCGGGGLEPKVVEIVAMRGRNPDNPSARTVGIPTEQRLEPNSQGMCNTLTSVQKDNLVLEQSILAPKKTEYGKEIRNKYERHEVSEKRGNMTQYEPRKDGIANTLTTVQKDNIVLEQKTVKVREATQKGYTEVEIGGVANLEYPTSQTRRGRAIENGKMSPTLTTGNIPSVIELADEKFYNFLYNIDGITYLIRIRKLIPLECWRLMGFSDEDFHKAEQVNSNTQLYKQAGNSIVVNVLEAIFKQFF